MISTKNDDEDTEKLLFGRKTVALWLLPQHFCAEDQALTLVKILKNLKSIFSLNNVCGNPIFFKYVYESVYQGSATFTVLYREPTACLDKI